MRFLCAQCKGIITVPEESMGQAVACSLCTRFVMVPGSRLAAGAVIGNDFAVEKELARGGMGTVYLAQQITLDRPVALKIMHRQFSEDPVYIKDFLHEARAAAKLNHPGIVQAYAVGEDAGIFYFAMEYVKGTTVKNILTHSNRIVPDRALTIMRTISEALQYAWTSQKLVHRDIKPDNIMLNEKGAAKLADLGLAKKATDLMESESDEVAGTPHYMSPEQILLKPLECRSDMYSLGATFYKALTGSFPFSGETPSAIAMKHLGEVLVPPCELVKDLSDQVSILIEIMLAKRPEHRHANYEELIRDIDLVKAGKYPQRELHPESQKPLEESGVTEVTTATTRTKRRSLVKPGSRPAAAGATRGRTTTGNLQRTGGLGAPDVIKPVPAGAVRESTPRNWKPLIMAGGAVLAIALVALISWGGWRLHWNSLSAQEKELYLLRKKYGERQVAAYQALLKLPQQKTSDGAILQRVRAYYQAYPKRDDMTPKVEAFAEMYTEAEIRFQRRSCYEEQLKKWKSWTPVLKQRKAQADTQRKTAELEGQKRKQAEDQRRQDDERNRQAQQERNQHEKQLWDDFQKKRKNLRLEFARACRANQFTQAVQVVADLQKSDHGGIKDWAIAKATSAQLAEQVRALVLNSQDALKGEEIQLDPKKTVKAIVQQVVAGFVYAKEVTIPDPTIGVKLVTNKKVEFDKLPLAVRVDLMDRAITKAGDKAKELDKNRAVGAYLLAGGYLEDKLPGHDKEGDPAEVRRRLESLPKVPETERLLNELKDLENLAKRQEFL